MYTVETQYQQLPQQQLPQQQPWQQQQQQQQHRLEQPVPLQLRLKKSPPQVISQHQ